MSKTVKVIYNADTLQTIITVDGQPFDTSRINGKEIEDWAYPFMMRKVKWNGFYDEMVDALGGQKAFNLIFNGSDEALAELKESWDNAPVTVVSKEESNNIVIIEYDENTLTTNITINGQPFDTSRINGKEIEDWVYPFMMRKVKWNGIFEELANVIGSEEYNIQFFGSETAMNELADECPNGINICKKSTDKKKSLFSSEAKDIRKIFIKFGVNAEEHDTETGFYLYFEDASDWIRDLESELIFNEFLSELNNYALNNQSAIAYVLLADYYTIVCCSSKENTSISIEYIIKSLELSFFDYTVTELLSIISEDIDKNIEDKDVAYKLYEKLYHCYNIYKSPGLEYFDHENEHVFNELREQFDFILEKLDNNSELFKKYQILSKEYNKLLSRQIEKSAEKGHHQAQVIFADMEKEQSENKFGDSPDITDEEKSELLSKVDDFLYKSITTDDENTQDFLSEEEAEIIEHLANDGNPCAETLISMSLFDDDPEMSSLLLEDAAEQKYDMAMLFLASNYMEEEQNINYEKIIDLLLSCSASQRFDNVLSELSNDIEDMAHDLANKGNYELSLQYRLFNEKYNYRVSISNLGWHYHYGKGVNIDLDKARSYYKKAIALGDEWSKNKLSELENSISETTTQITTTTTTIIPKKTTTISTAKPTVSTVEKATTTLNKVVDFVESDTGQNIIKVGKVIGQIGKALYRANQNRKSASYSYDDYEDYDDEY